MSFIRDYANAFRKRQDRRSAGHRALHPGDGRADFTPSTQDTRTPSPGVERLYDPELSISAFLRTNPRVRSRFRSSRIQSRVRWCTALVDSLLTPGCDIRADTWRGEARVAWESGDWGPLRDGGVLQVRCMYTKCVLFVVQGAHYGLNPEAPSEHTNVFNLTFGNLRRWLLFLLTKKQHHRSRSLFASIC